MAYELLIQHGDKVFIPAVSESVTWKTERKGSPGQLSFSVVADDVLKITEGDAVRFKEDEDKIFYGFIFKLQRDKDNIIKVTCYDQLRYLKNKDTYVYENKKANELIAMICADFGLQTGSLEDTQYKIASRVESNTSLFDMIQNALDETLTNMKYMYVLYDDFGKVTLKGLDSLRTNILIDEETGENFDYTSSIDEQTYNQIKLTFENDKTGKRDVYIAKSGANINQWGVLQYYDTLKEGENGQAKADALLSLYNAKSRKLTIKNAWGSNKVRAGSMVVVMMNLGDVSLKNLMLVESCTHNYYESYHTMDLVLRGGEFNG